MGREFGLLTEVSSAQDYYRPPLPTAESPKCPGRGSHVTLIHARDGFQMDTSPVLAYRHISHSIDGVLMMLKFQPSFLDILGREWGE